MTTQPAKPAPEPTESEDAFFDQLYTTEVVVGSDDRCEPKPEAVELLRAYVASQLAAKEAECARLREALSRIVSSIPTDRNERTGMRGIHHDEQPDAPGGFLECDYDELLDEISARANAALQPQQQETSK